MSNSKKNIIYIRHRKEANLSVHAALRQAIHFVLGLYTAFALTACEPKPLHQSVSEFEAELEKASSVETVSLKDLQLLNPLLLSPETMFPNFSKFSKKAIFEIYHYRQRCHGSLNSATEEFQKFEVALCKKTQIPKAWFLRNPIHPFGGSTAWHYLLSNPEDTHSLQNFLHVREGPQLLESIGKLSDKNLDALIKGHKWLLQNGELWRLHNKYWHRYEPSQWLILADQANIDITTTQSKCEMKLHTLCINKKKSYVADWRFLIGLCLLALLFVAMWVSWQHHLIRRRQQFINQMLTHELRTPITQLTNVVEQFRRDFEQLPVSAQLNFGSLADASQRMRQMAEASRHYLTVQNKSKNLEAWSTVLLSEWIEHLTEPYSKLSCILEFDQQVKLRLFWTTVCLNNLLNNAFLHGQPPVTLSVTVKKSRLIFEVRDMGFIPAERISQVQSNISPHAGMGVGLTIVKNIAQRLKGRLRFSTHPTTFILELPCDD